MRWRDWFVQHKPRPCLAWKNALRAQQCDRTAQLASAQLNLKESLEDMRYGAQLRRIHNRLLQRMEEENLVHGLVKHSPNMLDLADASGAAAAIYYSNEWTIIGVPPQ